MKFRIVTSTALVLLIALFGICLSHDIVKTRYDDCVLKTQSLKKKTIILQKKNEQITELEYIEKLSPFFTYCFDYTKQANPTYNVGGAYSNLRKKILNSFSDLLKRKKGLSKDSILSDYGFYAKWLNDLTIDFGQIAEILAKHIQQKLEFIQKRYILQKSKMEKNRKRDKSNAEKLLNSDELNQLEDMRMILDEKKVYEIQKDENLNLLNQEITKKVKILKHKIKELGVKRESKDTTEDEKLKIDSIVDGYKDEQKIILKEKEEKKNEIFVVYHQNIKNLEADTNDFSQNVKAIFKAENEGQESIRNTEKKGREEEKSLLRIFNYRITF